MKSLLALVRLPTAALNRVALIALAALVLPPILFGPWLPFLDLVAFVGLDNFPPHQSYGPLHYAVFQFTYIAHYALSRAMYALGIGPGAQVVLLYLLQAIVFFVVIWRLLWRLVPEPWLCSLAVALGTLAFWDGFFLWGGPLPFSLAATALAAATLGTIREVESPDRSDQLLVPLLLFGAVVCHPFALLFSLVLGGLRWVFVPSRRVPAALLLVALTAFGWIVLRDSPESGASAGVASLFGLPGSQVPQRIVALFQADTSFTHQLFGFCPPGLRGYFLILGAIHLAGFLASPVVLVLARESRVVRLLAALNTIVAVLYFCSRQADAVIPGWPWRITTFYSPFTFVAGVAGPLYLLRRWRPALLAAWAAPRRSWWIAPVALAGLMVVVQVPLLRLGDNIARSYEQARASLLRSGVANAYVVATDVDAIQPFYLRCVPFLLFSDPQIVARNVFLFTEWHIQYRHPTRLVETWFDLGRPSLQASFLVSDRTVDVRVVPLAAGQVALPVGNNQGERGGKPNLAMMQYTHANHLMGLGCVRDATLHYEAALRISPGFAEAHNNLGVALLSAGRRESAAEHFLAATRYKAGYADAHANLGLTLAQLGKVAEAREQFQIALRINPEQAAARAALSGAAGR